MELNSKVKYKLTIALFSISTCVVPEIKIENINE